MAREADSIKALTPLLGFVPGSIGALYHVYKAIGPEMPSDLKPTPAKSHIPDAPVMHFNYDEGHAGRFSVPNTEGGSLPFDWVLSRDDPAKFIMNHLAFRAKVGDALMPNNTDEKEHESGDQTSKHLSNTEFTVFVPGLNTLHQPCEGESTTVERLMHYVRILGAVPMTQIHMGTSFDQGQIRVNPSGGGLIHALFNNPLIPEGLKASYDNSSMVWDSRQIDRLQAALSKTNFIDTPAKSSMRALMTSAVDGTTPPVVILAYSRASIEIDGAVKKFIKDRVEGGDPIEQVEHQLRECVTIVTIGSATASFPDGPAYVHIAAWTDPLASTSGVTATNNADSAGREAVFLNCASPYHEAAFDNHNFGAVTGQFVAIVLAVNKARGFRQLWQLAQDGNMVIPEDCDSLTRALIALTKGYDWLWNSDAAWKDIAFGALPEADEAEALLRKRLGEAFVDRILKNFGPDS